MLKNCDNTIRGPIVVTGGEYRIALAVTRALGRAGIQVAVLSHEPHAITFSSKYCTQRILTPPDYRQKEYVDFLEEMFSRQRFAGLLFCDDLAVFNIGMARDRLLPLVPFMLPAQEWIELTMNKRKMLHFALEQGITVPATVFPTSADSLADETRGMQYPLMVKGTRGDSSRHLRIISSNSNGELEDAFQTIRRLENEQGIDVMPVVQEYVSGEVYSAIILCDHSTVRACFMMKKLRMFPSWGGICVEGVSVYFQEIMKEVKSLIDKAPWHGILEVEFILDQRDGRFKLIEFTPVFNWGIDFAIYSGVDFPAISCRLMQGCTVPASEGPQYRVGNKFMWFLPEGIKYMWRHPRSIPHFLMKTLDPRIGSDIHVSDAGALIRQVKRGLRSLIAT